MAAGKVVGQIQVTQGIVKVLGADGAVREPKYGGFMYENEQIISNDPTALFQIKFLALPEASAYDGIFRILADGTALHGRDAVSSMAASDEPVSTLEAAAEKESVDDLETAAGEEGAEGSSSFTETDIVAESSVLGFGRGPNSALGYGVVDFGSRVNYDASQEAAEAENAINNNPLAMADNITKIADHEIIRMLYPLPTLEGTSVVEQNKGWYGIIDDSQGDGDPASGNPLVDSHSENEGIKFIFTGDISEATIWFKNIGDNPPSNDNILIELWNNEKLVAVVDNTDTIDNKESFIIKDYGYFDEIRIIALDPVGENGNPPTEFRVSSPEVADLDRDWVLPFVIDDSMLLANDTDIDGDALHVELVDGNLYDSDGEIIGSVSIITDTSSDNYGDIQVTPDPIYEFDIHTPNYANFAYTVVDEHGGSSESVLATIDVALGEVVNHEVNYDPALSGSIADEFIIGTDSDIEVDDGVDILSNNILTISDTLNLSNVSDINTIQLDADATVTGSGPGLSITANDVINATDVDNTLIIQSSDGNASTQAYVDSTFGDATTVVIDGNSYAQYVDGDATLLIQIEDIVVPT